MNLRFLLIFATLAGCSQRVAPFEITSTHPAHPGAAEAPAPVFTIRDDFEKTSPESNASPEKQAHGHRDMPKMKACGGDR